MELKWRNNYERTYDVCRKNRNIVESVYIRMDGWRNVLGFIFIGIGFGLMNYDSHRKGREEGFKEGVEHVIQYAKEKMNEREQ